MLLIKIEPYYRYMKYAAQPYYVDRPRYADKILQFWSFGVIAGQSIGLDSNIERSLRVIAESPSSVIMDIWSSATDNSIP